jgi:glycerol-3-phosphate dehydrogenase
MLSPSGLITITGGKWTTYRKMAEDTVDLAIESAGLTKRFCKTKTLYLHGYHESVDWLDSFFVYGSDATSVKALTRENPAWKETLDPRLPYIGAEIIWATRYEMARRIEDVLARRTRALFLDARAAMAMAPAAAHLMAEELNKDVHWEKEQVLSFNSIAKNYLLND